MEPFVCTDKYPEYYRKQINKLRDDLREQFLLEDQTDRKLQDVALADAAAAVRFKFDQRKNSRYQRYGVNLIREKHRAPAGKETEREERNRRVLDLLPSIEHHIEKIVQTIAIDNPVQTSSEIVQTVEAAPVSPAKTTPQRSKKTAPRVQSSNPEKKDPQTATATNPQREQQQQPARWDPNLWPQTDEAITANFPATSPDCRARILRNAVAAADGFPVTDRALSLAITTATDKNQRNGALYETTVPNVIRNWVAKERREKSA